MDLDTQLLLTRLQSRLSELETWIGMLVVRHGSESESGYHYEMCDAHAAIVRSEMPRPQVAVSITYDYARGAHVIDVI